LAELLPLQMYVTNLLLEERGGQFTGTNDQGCQEGILCWEKLLVCFFFPEGCSVCYKMGEILI